jgi:hypothetical protein
MPLVFESSDGQQRLELEVVGYESPDVEDEQYDSNWLLVRVEARDGETIWSAEDPALLTWELERLAGWLARLARGRFQHPWCGFVEPNLEFRADALPEGDGARLRVYFELELRPPGRRSSVVGRRDVFLKFDLSPDALRAAAHELHAQLQRFPVRPW